MGALVNQSSSGNTFCDTEFMRIIPVSEFSRNKKVEIRLNVRAIKTLRLRKSLSRKVCLENQGFCLTCQKYCEMSSVSKSLRFSAKSQQVIAAQDVVIAEQLVKS